MASGHRVADMAGHAEQEYEVDTSGTSPFSKHGRQNKKSYQPNTKFYNKIRVATVAGSVGGAEQFSRAVLLQNNVYRDLFDTGTWITAVGHINHYPEAHDHRLWACWEYLHKFVVEIDARMLSKIFEATYLPPRDVDPAKVQVIPPVLYLREAWYVLRDGTNWEKVVDEDQVKTYWNIDRIGSAFKFACHDAGERECVVHSVAWYMTDLAVWAPETSAVENAEEQKEVTEDDFKTVKKKLFSNISFRDLRELLRMAGVVELFAYYLAVHSYEHDTDLVMYTAGVDHHNFKDMA